MLLLFFSASLLCFCFYNFYLKRKGLPPGPFPLPLVGNLHQLDPLNKHKTIFEWSQKYGPILTVWIGSKPFVFITDYGKMKELFVGRTGEIFANRHLQRITGYDFRDGKYGIICMDGADWKEQRRFALHTFKDFGVGKNLMEKKIQTRVQELIQVIQELLEGQKSLCLDHALEICVGSVINSIIFGRGFQMGDHRFIRMKALLDQFVELCGRWQMQLLNGLPWLRHLPIFRSCYRRYLGCKTGFWQLLREELDNNKSTFDPQEPPSDFVSAYLKEIHSRWQRGQSLGSFSEKQLTVVVGDIWFAGQETTVTTLRWAILYMIHHPSVQAKVQQELDSYLGQNDSWTISMSDRARLPYTAATIQEIQRLTNLVPINVPHTVAVDVAIDGFQISRGTTVIPQISAVLMNPKIFPEPDKLQPERFLDSDGRLKKVEEFIPFSIGKRICLGEGLAKVELFLIFAVLLREFEFSCVPDQPKPTLTPVMGFVRRPAQYQVSIRKRTL